MPIPESQLSTWSNIGAQETAKRAYRSIEGSIDDHDWPQGMDPEIFLQGSYRNNTNIHGDSDVDIVARAPAWLADIDELDGAETRRYNRNTSDADYTYQDFREEVLAALEAAYGADAVTEGRKAIKVDGTSSRQTADVLPAITYKKYTSYGRPGAKAAIQGITFRVDAESRWYENYPKRHYEYGARKNKRTGKPEAFRPLVRIFKNARTHMVENGMLAEAVAPSYFLSCLLYNVPNELIDGSYQDMYKKAALYLMYVINEEEHAGWVCQHEVHGLLGSEPERWNLESAARFLLRAWDLWEDW